MGGNLARMVDLVGQRRHAVLEALVIDVVVIAGGGLGGCGGAFGSFGGFLVLAHFTLRILEGGFAAVYCLALFGG